MVASYSPARFWNQEKNMDSINDVMVYWFFIAWTRCVSFDHVVSVCPAFFVGMFCVNWSDFMGTLSCYKKTQN